MLERRIRGVMKQYGPEVAFFTVRVMQGGLHLGTWTADQVLESELGERSARSENVFRGLSEPELATTRYDVIVPWVALHVSRWLKIEMAEGLTSRSLTSRSNIYRLTNYSITDVADWANATHPNLMSMSVPEVVAATRDWHEEMEHAATGAVVGMGEIVHRFADGWTFQKLTTGEQLHDEGEAQGICVGQETYVHSVERGEMLVYSLRDAKNVPHATVEARIMWPRTVGAGEPILRVMQVKGRGNSRVTQIALCRRLDESFRAAGLEISGTQPGMTLYASEVCDFSAAFGDWHECYEKLHPYPPEERAENPVRSNWDDAAHARLPNPRARRGRPAPRMPEGATTYMVPLRKGLLPARLYHVTLSQHVPAIMRQGLVPMKTSNWRKGGAGGDRYGEGEVFAFEDKYDALHWAAKWDLNHHKMLGSGKITIVELDNAFDDWEIDVADPLAQLQAAGRWLKRRSAIGPQHIVRADVFTPEDAQHWLAEQQRRLYGGA